MHGNLVRCGVYMKEARRATKQVVADTMAFAFLMIGAWHGADVLSFFGRNQGGAPSFRLGFVLLLQRRGYTRALAPLKRSHGLAYPCCDFQIQILLHL